MTISVRSEIPYNQYKNPTVTASAKVDPKYHSTNT